MTEPDPTIKAIEIAAVKRCILIADGPCPAVRSAHGRKNKLPPQTQRHPVEIAARGADAPKLESIITREASRYFWDQARSCGDGNEIAVVLQAVEHLTAIVGAVPRSHLMPPRDEAFVEFVSADRVKRYERGQQQHPAHYPSLSSRRVAEPRRVVWRIAPVGAVLADGR